MHTLISCQQQNDVYYNLEYIFQTRDADSVTY